MDRVTDERSEAASQNLVPVAIRTLGCKVNRVESEGIAAELLGMGATIVDEDAAQVIVINTCTVTGEADAKARKAVRQALNGDGSPIVVVTGCLAAVDRAALERLGERVVVEVDKERVSARVSELLGLRPVGSPVAATPRVGAAFRTRVQLKVQDGCDCFCSYCIVPYARGVPRSVPLARIAEQTQALVEAGAREVVLTGINLGRYRDGGADLADVVRVVADAGARRLRLSSIEPLDIDERLLAALAETPSVCAHLHVPLQSGSDPVLSAMRRGYDVAEFERRVAAAREIVPALALTTDIIAGFPGETAADHAATLGTIERIGFSKLHVFRYSARANTPAAAMPDQVAPDVRAARAGELRDLGERLRESFSASRAGETVEVLVERIDDGIAVGTTREYLHVETAVGPEVAIGDLIDVVYRPSAV